MLKNTWVAGAAVLLCGSLSGAADFAPRDKGYKVSYPDRVARERPLRGVMSPAVPSEKDFRDLKAWGATLMRYQMRADAGKEGASKAERLAAFDASLARRLDHLERNLIPWGKKYGVRLVVDLHDPPGGRGAGGEVEMYHDAELSAHFVAFWRQVAVRFKGHHDVIYGYDLLNEPVQNRAGAPECDYWTVQRRAAEAIRETDRETSIIVAANNWDLSDAFARFPALEMDNVIYTVHVYEPHAFTHQGVQKQWPRGVKWPSADGKGVTYDRAWLDAKLRPVRQFAYNHKARIYVGEFSAIAWGEGSERYLSDCISLFEQYGWDWTYHAFREWPGWSVEHVCRADDAAGGFVASADNPRMRVLKAGLGGRIDPSLVTWTRDAAEQARQVDAGWKACMDACWSPKTSLVYGCAPSKVRPAKAFDDGPGYYRWQRDVKGKNHYGEGMGDCALICGTALSGIVDRWLVTGDSETRELAAKVARGVLNLAVLHGFKGFVARGICEEDGRSVCSLSSRDQYTHWLHGLLRYVESGLADEAFRREFAAALADVAAFMERKCTPERNWNFGMVDGSDDPRGICTMWGPDLHPHEQARLPMVYGAAARVTGDGHWRELYGKYIDEALAKSQGMADEKETRIMPCYSLLQAMCSFEILLLVEKDPARVALIRKAMEATAAAAEKRARLELAQPRKTFYGMCDDGELSLTMAMLPGEGDAAFKSEFLSRTLARAPLAISGTCRNAHVYAAYWRSRNRPK